MADGQVKACVICAALKPLSAFYRRGEVGRENHYRSECKACCANRYRASRASRYKRLAYLHKMKNIERKYGITRDQYAEMLTEQDHKCKACRQPFVGYRGPASPHVDHDHRTGKVRGILCCGCNQALGLARESPNTLRALAAYMETAK